MIASLLARFNPVGPVGLLVTQQTALTANPDLGLFVSLPLPAVISEQGRVNVFRLALVAIPLPDPIPIPLLTANMGFALARQSFITTVRIPEMNAFLNTNPGYYNTRFQVMRRRVAGGGTVHEVEFLQTSIVNANSEIVTLEEDREFLESLLP